MRCLVWSPTVHSWGDIAPHGGALWRYTLHNLPATLCTPAVRLRSENRGGWVLVCGCVRLCVECYIPPVLYTKRCLLQHCYPCRCQGLKPLRLDSGFLLFVGVVCMCAWFWYVQQNPFRHTYQNLLECSTLAHSFQVG